MFNLFAKGLVNGQGENPIYTWLKGHCGPTSPVIGIMPYISWSPVLTTDITWNFEKFLISRSGHPFKRYNPDTDPSLMVSDLEFLLNQ